MTDTSPEFYFALDQIIGAREVQEDSLAYVKDIKINDNICDLFCLADGMGGHAAGDLASKVAIEAAISHIKSSEKEDISRILFDAATMSNREISNKVRENSKLEGMGCTLILSIIIENNFYHCSVGDSLILLYRDKKLLRINEDHSMKPVLEKMHSEGLLTAEELQTDSRRNALRSSIYGEVIELIDHPAEPLELEEDDLIIIASDGIEAIENDEIIDTIVSERENGPETICKCLLDRVSDKKNKNQDNTSIIIIDSKKMKFGNSR